MTLTSATPLVSGTCAQVSYPAAIYKNVSGLVSSISIPASSILHKVKEVAKIVLKIASTIFLYWLNPSICAVGFIVGIAFDEHISLAITKIQNVIKTQPFGMCILGGLAGILALPVALATASLVWPAHIGTLMSRKAKEVLAGSTEHPSEDETPQTPAVTSTD